MSPKHLGRRRTHLEHHPPTAVTLLTLPLHAQRTHGDEIHQQPTLAGLDAPAHRHAVYAQFALLVPPFGLHQHAESTIQIFLMQRRFAIETQLQSLRQRLYGFEPHRAGVHQAADQQPEQQPDQNQRGEKT